MQGEVGKIESTLLTTDMGFMGGDNGGDCSNSQYDQCHKATNGGNCTNSNSACPKSTNRGNCINTKKQSALDEKLIVP